MNISRKNKWVKDIQTLEGAIAFSACSWLWTTSAAGVIPTCWLPLPSSLGNCVELRTSSLWGEPSRGVAHCLQNRSKTDLCDNPIKFLEPTILRDLWPQPGYAQQPVPKRHITLTCATLIARVFPEATGRSVTHASVSPDRQTDRQEDILLKRTCVGCQQKGDLFCLQLNKHMPIIHVHSWTPHR